MHYLFFDESYTSKAPGKIVFAGWAVGQDRLNRKPILPEDLRRTPVLQTINGVLEGLDAWAHVARVSMDPVHFRSGEIDGTDDVARMSRTDNIWATCSTFLVTGIMSGFYKRKEELGTVDVYHDPKSLTPAHDDARRKALRGLVVGNAREASAAQKGNPFEKLNIRRIESVAKASHSLGGDKFQIGVWICDKLCRSADAVAGGQFTRIRSYDMSEEVRRTIQQWDGKRFEED